MKFRAPANVMLRRAQLVLLLAALVPTVLLLATGIVLLIVGSGSVTLVTGILVLAFCTSSLTGYILGSIFMTRGAALARVQNDFVSSVSHELRTPLTSIRMFMETLVDERLTDPEEKAKCYNLLQQEVNRLEAMVARMTDLSRFETGAHILAQDRVSVDALIKEALAVFDAATLPKPTIVEVDLAPNLDVIGDHAALVRAVSNLLINAWKYTPDENRKIRVVARASGKRHVEISVIDNGIGISRAEQRRIFGIFERGDATLEQPIAGVGLGLSIVRAIVRAHKGKVDVHSRPNDGAEFRIRLRRRRPAGKAGTVDAPQRGAA